MTIAIAIGAAALLAACAGDQRMASATETKESHVQVGHVLERVVGEQVQAALSAAEAAPRVADMETLTQTIPAGTDIDHDCTVGWEENEGGLAHAAQHMQFMQEGEGMA
jgi:hypothetical protein